MRAIKTLLKNMYMQQNPLLSEEGVDDKMREALHKENILTPRSSTSILAPSHQKILQLTLIKIHIYFIKY